MHNCLFAVVGGMLCKRDKPSIIIIIIGAQYLRSPVTATYFHFILYHAAPFCEFDINLCDCYVIVHGLYNYIPYQLRAGRKNIN